MERLTYLLAFSLLFFGCNTEVLEIEEQTLDDNVNYEVSETIISGDESSTNDSDDEYCFSTKLIAGQHHEAGMVTITVTEDQLIITYTTNGDWTIDATHLSIGGCNDGSIPTNGSGNPQIGHFEYHSEHSDGVNQVTYTFDLDDIPDQFCFAAHAEVNGPTGEETAWAEGEEFSGNSWAMYVEVDISNYNDIILPE
jgi:hypothetical protein